MKSVVERATAPPVTMASATHTWSSALWRTYKTTHPTDRLDSYTAPKRIALQLASKIAGIPLTSTCTCSIRRVLVSTL